MPNFRTAQKKVEQIPNYYSHGTKIFEVLKLLRVIAYHQVTRLLAFPLFHKKKQAFKSVRNKRTDKANKSMGALKPIFSLKRGLSPEVDFKRLLMNL